MLPQWSAWPMIGIFNSYIEIEKWVSELHEDYAESTVSSIFATFSTFLNAAVRARIIPASPCSGIRVTSGEYAPERLVASPVQALRAGMRLYESGLGLGGFTLCLVDVYTGGRWGELAGQQRHEYDAQKKAIGIQAPLKEAGGVLKKHGKAIGETDAVASTPPSRRRRGAAARKGRTETPAGTRWVELPPSIAAFTNCCSTTTRIRSCSPRRKGTRGGGRTSGSGTGGEPGMASTPTTRVLMITHRRSCLGSPSMKGRHTHATWLTEDGVSEVARRVRLGQKMKGIARVYDHVTDVMRKQILDVLEMRWEASLLALTVTERARLTGWFPHVGPVITRLMIENEDGKKVVVSHSSPTQD